MLPNINIFVYLASKRALPVGSQGEPTCRGTPPTSILISEEGIGLPDVESVEHPMPPSVEELQRPESGTALRPVAKSHCVVGEPLLSNDASVGEINTCTCTCTCSCKASMYMYMYMYMYICIG